MGPGAALKAAVGAGVLPPRGRGALLVACSGGRDSMALCHALRAHGGWRLVVGTVDHGLRAESAADAAFVLETARGWGLEAQSVRAVVSRDGAEGPEDAARRVRHAALEGLRDAVGASRVVYAHTADDQWETLMMRLASGAGTGGLGGMAPVEGTRARPWLSVRRADVAAYAEAQGVPWREDATNATLDFLRNRVRAQLLPVFEAVFGSTGVGGTIRSAENLRAADGVVRAWLSAQRARWVLAEEVGAPGTAVFVIDAAALRAVGAPERRVVVHGLLVDLYTRAGRRAPRRMSDRVSRICEALVSGHGRGVGSRDGFAFTQGRGGATLRLAPAPPAGSPGTSVPVDASDTGS